MKYEIGDLVQIQIMKLNAIVIGIDGENVILYSYYNNGCTMCGPFNEVFVELLTKDTLTKKQLKGRVITKELLVALTFPIEQDCKNDTK